jgi:hypothetical protein
LAVVEIAEPSPTLPSTETITAAKIRPVRLL